MAPTPTKDGPENQRGALFRCDCHLKHSTQLSQHDKDIASMKEQHQEDIKTIAQDVKGRVTHKYFLALVALVVGTLGFQWMNYEKLSVINTKMAVVETTLKLHMEEQKKYNGLYKYFPKQENSIKQER